MDRSGFRGGADAVSSLRRGTLAAFNRHFPEGRAAVLSGVVLGETASMPRETSNAFRDAGAIHLTASASHPAFTANCWAHASAGHARGLVLAAERTGRPEPAAALAAAGDWDAAPEAAARALDHTPDVPVLQHLAAVWGPQLDPLACKLVQHLLSSAAARALVHPTRTLPRTSRLLAAVIPGLS